MTPFTCLLPLFPVIGAGIYLHASSAGMPQVLLPDRFAFGTVVHLLDIPMELLLYHRMDDLRLGESHGLKLDLKYKTQETSPASPPSSPLSSDIHSYCFSCCPSVRWSVRSFQAFAS